MKVTIPIAEQHYRSFVTVVDMMNRPTQYTDEQTFAEFKARHGDLASLGGAMVQAVEAMGGFPGTPPVPPPNPPPSGDLCAACVGTVRRHTLVWGDIKPIHTVELDGFNCEDYLVCEFTVPANAVNGAIDGRAVVAEYGGPDGPTTFRQITISNSPCDFRTPDPTGVNGPFMWSNGTSATVVFNVGAVHALNGGASLIPGRTYYVNVRNYSIDNGGPTCLPGGPTNAIIQPDWPR